MRRLALVMGLFLGLSAPAYAQQAANANIGLGSVPPGITVMVTGSVPVDTWVETASFDAKSATKAEQFADALRGAGVPPAGISVQPTVVFGVSAWAITARFAPSVSARVAQLARAHGITQNQLQMEPADPQALYERAVTLAIEQGRKTATAIAAADRQHIGRLLNFVPSPIEMAKQLASSTLAASAFTSAADGTVSAYGIATFELSP